MTIMERNESAEKIVSSSIDISQNKRRIFVSHEKVFTDFIIYTVLISNVE